MRTNEFIGITATPIGESYAVFVTELRQTVYRTLDQADELRIFINPRITDVSGETVTIYEGRGSVTHGGTFGTVVRPGQITVKELTDWLKPARYPLT